MSTSRCWQGLESCAGSELHAKWYKVSTIMKMLKVYGMVRVVLKWDMPEDAKRLCFIIESVKKIRLLQGL